MTTYTYGPVGNLDDTTIQPNGVVHDYDYNRLNRLEFVTVSDSAGNLFTQKVN